MEIKVLKHEKQKRGGYFFNHKALIELSGVDNVEDVEEKIAYETSIQVNYHPLGYGMYGSKVRKSNKENEYIVVWETGSSCD